MIARALPLRFPDICKNTVEIGLCISYFNLAYSTL